MLLFLQQKKIIGFKGAGLLLATLVFFSSSFLYADDSTMFANAARDRNFALYDQLQDQHIDINTLSSDGTPALHWLVRFNELERVRNILDQGADINLLSRYGVNAIYIAAELGYLEMMELLLSFKANVNSFSPTNEPVLFATVRSGNIEALKLLLDSGAELDAVDEAFNQTALMLASRTNNFEMVFLLLQRGADVNAFTKTGTIPNFRLPGAGGGSHGDGIVRGGWPEQGMRNSIPGRLTPLHYAARDGHLNVARILLEAGANINATNANESSALLLAIMNNNIDLAFMLLQNGADYNQRNWYGQSALWSAVDVRNMAVNGSTLSNNVDRLFVLELIKVLLEKGAFPDARVKEVPPLRSWNMPLGSLSWVDFTGQTPFLRAALSGDITVMELLLEYKADPMIETFQGSSALMAAAGVNWVFNQTFDEGDNALLEAVQLCVELGLDVNASNSMGINAMHGAANRGSDAIIEFLHASGARLDFLDNENRSVFDWAQGVFLATHAPFAKPTTLILLTSLQDREGSSR